VCKDRPQTLAALLEEPGERDKPIASSAIRAWRGYRSQVEIAQAAGISQGFLSELESAHKQLTPGVARRLAPALGTTATQLVLGEQLAKLNRAAQKARIDLQPLLAEAERLVEIIPRGEVGDAIVDALIGVVREQPNSLT
jgi:transcriptional regulator with XRE-family HTH domain